MNRVTGETVQLYLIMRLLGLLRNREFYPLFKESGLSRNRDTTITRTGFFMLDDVRLPSDATATEG
uniref:Uncharacterized protein n=1 Tax=Romanomermis culicivorax TaxID=13658 RepID=A0A915HZY7_ROMCU